MPYLCCCNLEGKCNSFDVLHFFEKKNKDLGTISFDCGICKVSILPRETIFQAFSSREAHFVKEPSTE